jgi:hypothetical protein
VQSAKIQVRAIGLINANTEAFKAGEIDIDTFAALTHATGRLVEGIKFYRVELAKVETAAEVAKANPGKDVLNTLFVIFDSRVAGVVIELATMLKVISGPQSEKIKAIIAGLQLLISSMKGLFADARNSIEGGQTAWVPTRNYQTLS